MIVDEQHAMHAERFGNRRQVQLTTAVHPRLRSCGFFVRAQRQRQRDRGSPIRRAVQLKRPAHRFHAFANAEESKMHAYRPRGQRFHIEGMNQLRIVIADHGSGFDVESLAARPAGVHFGLFIIRERMEAMGGSFQLDSAPGQGTTVTLTLPLSTDGDSARAQTTMNSRDQLPVPPVPKVSGVHRVLLVDDHVIIRQGLRTILEGYDDVSVIAEAGNGVEAVSLAAEMRPDAIVMDINMPQMDGIEATKQIKGVQPDTIVIGMSVNTSPQIVEAMTLAGASAFLSKEAAVDKLYETIVKLRQQSHVHGPPVGRVGSHSASHDENC